MRFDVAGGAMYTWTTSEPVTVPVLDTLTETVNLNSLSVTSGVDS